MTYTDKTEAIFNYYTRSSLETGLRQIDTPPHLINLISGTFSQHITILKDRLKIQIPVVIKQSSIEQTLKDREDSDKGKILYGYFVPGFDEFGKLISGDIRVDLLFLTTYAKEIDRGAEDKPYTPWELIGTLAHELRHAYQYESGFAEDDEIPYEARQTEYDARHFEFDYVKSIKPQDHADYLRKVGYLTEVRAIMWKIKRNQKRINNTNK